jgi:hypothetical protein
MLANTTAIAGAWSRLDHKCASARAWNRRNSQKRVKTLPSSRKTPMKWRQVLSRELVKKRMVAMLFRRANFEVLLFSKREGRTALCGDHLLPVFAPDIFGVRNLSDQNGVIADQIAPISAEWTSASTPVKWFGIV